MASDVSASKTASHKVNVKVQGSEPNGHAAGTVLISAPVGRLSFNHSGMSQALHLRSDSSTTKLDSVALS